MTDAPPSQVSIYALNTATPNMAHLMPDLYLYRQCTYTNGRWTTLCQLCIDVLNTSTPNLAHIKADLYICRQYTYINGSWTPSTICA